MTATTNGFNGLTAKGVPALPKWLLFLRIAIIVLSLGVLIAAAYNLSLFNSAYLAGYSGPAGFLIFDAVFTWLILGAMLAAEFFAPQLYIRLAFVAALILAAIFWLSAWAWAASVASTVLGYDGLYYYYNDTFKSYGSSMAAAAALGAFTWVLVIVTIVFFVLACMKSPHDSSFNNTPRAQNDPEFGQQNKFEAQPNPNVVQPNPVH